MPVVLVHEGPTFTQERYEQVVAKLTGGKSRLESPADWPVDGLLAHIGGRLWCGLVRSRGSAQRS